MTSPDNTQSSSSEKPKHVTPPEATPTLVNAATTSSSEPSNGRTISVSFPHRVGPYKLLAKIGEGGMGAVYKARHTRLNKIVALKLLPSHLTRDPQALARFDREMKAVGALEH